MHDIVHSTIVHLGTVYSYHNNFCASFISERYEQAKDVHVSSF